MLRALALALGLTGLAASAVRAEPLFDAYQALCVKSGADVSPALAAADASGWSPVPQVLLQQLGGGAGVENAQGRMKSDAAGLSVVIVGHKPLPISGETVDMRFCAVAGTAPVSEALKSQLSAWTAVPADPALSATGRTGYIFTDDAGVHTVVSKPEDAQAKALLRSGRVRLAFIQEGKGMTLLAFAVPTM